MALLLILYLNVAVGAALAGIDLGPPGACLQGPKFWCQDAVTAAECKKEEYCWIHEWSSPLVRARNAKPHPSEKLPSSLSLPPHLQWKGLEEEDKADAPLIKCFVCTKIVKKIKDLAGDDPDDEKIEDAIASVCRVVGRFLRGTCKKLLRLFKSKLRQDLQAGLKARDICIDLNVCRDCLRALPEEEKIESSW
ncbi:antimicrobial peptide NK-lysin-like [Podarcis lilfordi]|uniref:Antimicrobial peptide NK-lysin-like n=1 Tax=Podarcis lilfordi TaxID=74358 RepID=A0AA35LGX8_9SAUR|nr:antimicrobial peptide NK-lysin-like [Podarcis lilfordi]